MVLQRERIKANWTISYEEVTEEILSDMPTLKGKGGIFRDRERGILSFKKLFMKLFLELLALTKNTGFIKA